MFDWKYHGNGIVGFDANYLRPFLASVHMVIENGRAAFIDTGSNASLPNVMDALDRVGLTAEAVDYVFLTHIHLDHAGAAGTMMRAFPHARLVVHPKGARHMAEPGKLIAAVRQVYGAPYVERVYGEILPVPVERIIEARDDSVISLGGRELLCLDTPGHANHHLCIVDPATGGIFTGDLFGLSYRQMDVGDRQFIFPTSSPSQFNPEAMRASVYRLLALKPKTMYLTHYGAVHDVARMAEDLLRRLDAMTAIALRARAPGPDRHQRIKSALTVYLLDEARAHGCVLVDRYLLDLWETDLELDTQGLCVWLDTLPA